MDTFEIDVAIKPDRTYSAFKEMRKCSYYQCSDDKNSWDSIEFRNNKIIISGNRYQRYNGKVRHIPEKALFTIKSTQHFDILKALIYYYFRWGSFTIEHIRFLINNSEVLFLKSDKLYQNFNKNSQNKVNNEVLEKMLEIKNDQNDFIVTLTYQISGNRGNFDHSWRSFNHVYNSVTGNKKDAESAKEILNKNVQIINNDVELLSDSKTFIDNLNDTRIIKWVIHDKKDINSIKDIMDLGEYHDNQLLKRILGIIDKIFPEFMNEDKSVSKSKKGNYKAIKKQVKNSSNVSDNFDYLRMSLMYAKYLRNKYFHGEYKVQTILKENDIECELKSINKIIQKLNGILINEYANELIAE